MTREEREQQTQTILSSKKDPASMSIESITSETPTVLPRKHIQLEDITQKIVDEEFDIDLSSAEHLQYDLGSFLESEFIQQSSRFLFVKSSDHNIDVLDKETLQRVQVMRAGRSKCLLDVEDYGHVLVGCWGSTVEVSSYLG